MSMDLEDVDPDPIVQFQRWQDDVIAAGLPEPMAMVLCTTSAAPDSQPLGRHVILRGLDHGGFAFVTDRDSRKGRQLAENPHACLVFPWFPIGRQVVVTGIVAEADDAESDAYWVTRPRGSQIAAWASDQSEPVADRAALDRRWSEASERFGEQPVPRPPNWGMYRLTPDTIEFWLQGEDRMHDRLLYERVETGWQITRLQP